MTIQSPKTLLGYPSPDWAFEEEVTKDQLNLMDVLVSSRIDKRLGQEDTVNSNLDMTVNSSLTMLEDSIIKFGTYESFKILANTLEIGAVVKGDTNADSPKPLNFTSEIIDYNLTPSAVSNSFFYTLISSLNSIGVLSETSLSLKELFDLNDTNGNGFVKLIYNSSNLVTLNTTYIDADDQPDGYLEPADGYSGVGQGCVLYSDFTNNSVHSACDSSLGSAIRSSSADIKSQAIATTPFNITNSPTIRTKYPQSIITDLNNSSIISVINDNFIFRRVKVNDCFQIDFSGDFSWNFPEDGYLIVRPSFQIFSNLYANLSAQQLSQLGSSQTSLIGQLGNVQLIEGSGSGYYFLGNRRMIWRCPMDGIVVFCLTFLFTDSTKTSFLDTVQIPRGHFHVKQLGNVSF